MDKFADVDSEILIAAEQAIENNECRQRLLVELWESLGLSEEVLEQVFHGIQPTVALADEKPESLIEVRRMRDMHSIVVREKGNRPRRPPSIRGLLI
jgi:type III secretion system LcrG-like protein